MSSDVTSPESSGSPDGTEATTTASTPAAEVASSGEVAAAPDEAKPEAKPEAAPAAEPEKPAEPADAPRTPPRTTGAPVNTGSGEHRVSRPSIPPTGTQRPVRATSSPVAAGGDPGEIPIEVDPSDKVAVLEAKIATLEKEKKDNWDRYLRSAADLENLRKRSKRDADDARSEMRGKVLKEILPVIDNLERAVEHAAPPPTDGGEAKPDPVLDGVRLVLRQFSNALEKLEVTAVEADGKPFDPNLHEAISQMDSDAHPPGTVLQVLQKGYRSGDRLLRPALVVVSKAKAEG